MWLAVVSKNTFGNFVLKFQPRNLFLIPLFMHSVPGYEQTAVLLCRWKTSAEDTRRYKSETNRIEFWEVLLRQSFKLLAPHVLWFPHTLNRPVSLTEKLSISSVFEGKGLQTTWQKTLKSAEYRKGYYIKPLDHYILIILSTVLPYK